MVEWRSRIIKQNRDPNAGRGGKTKETCVEDELRKIPMKNAIAYGIGDIYGSGAFILIGLLFLFFLTDYVGLSPALAGLVFAIGKGVDAISDPLMGYVSDITRSKRGRRRVYFLVGIVPVAVSFALLWIPIQGWSQAALFVYYSLAYVVFSLVFTMVMVPYFALNAEMSRDIKERNKLSGVRMICAQVANLIAGTIPGIILGLQLGSDQGINYLLVGIIFGVFFATPWLFVYLGTWELPVSPERSATPGLETGERMWSYFRRVFSVLKNRTFRIHIGMYVAAYSAIDLLMAVFVYFLTYYIGEQGWYTFAIGTLIITEIVFMPMYIWIANKFGKVVTYRIGLIVWLVGLGLAFLLIQPGTTLGLLMVVAAVLGSGMAAGILVPWASLPTIIDIDEMISGEKRAGLYSGFMTLIRKGIQGVIVIPAIGLVLEWIGFQANVEQSATTADGIRLLFVLGQVGFVGLGLAASLLYPVRPHIHRTLRSETDRINSGGARSAVTPEVRALCERVTGYDYQDLFPQAER